MKGFIIIMGRYKRDRSDKVMQAFESTKPLKARLEAMAIQKNKTVSALIREILEKFLEDRNF